MEEHFDIVLGRRQVLSTSWWTCGQVIWRQSARKANTHRWNILHDSWFAAGILVRLRTLVDGRSYILFNPLCFDNNQRLCCCWSSLSFFLCWHTSLTLSPLSIVSTYHSTTLHYTTQHKKHHESLSLVTQRRSLYNNRLYGNAICRPSVNRHQRRCFDPQDGQVSVGSGSDCQVQLVALSCWSCVGRVRLGWRSGRDAE